MSENISLLTKQSYTSTIGSPKDCFLLRAGVQGEARTNKPTIAHHHELISSNGLTCSVIWLRLDNTSRDFRFFKDQHFIHIKTLKSMKTNTKRGPYWTYKKQVQLEIRNIIAITASLAFLTIVGVSGWVESSIDKPDHTFVTVVKAEVIEERESILIPRKSNREEIKRIAIEECAKKGLGTSCVKDLLGIAHTEEQSFDCSQKGDNGKAFGCFQINLAQNPSVLEKDAKEIEYSVKWTLNRMISHGYPKYRSYAIRKHNGGATNPKTLVYLNKVNAYVQSIESELIIKK